MHYNCVSHCGITNLVGLAISVNGRLIPFGCFREASTCFWQAGPAPFLTCRTCMQTQVGETSRTSECSWRCIIAWWTIWNIPGLCCWVISMAGAELPSEQPTALREIRCDCATERDWQFDRNHLSVGFCIEHWLDWIGITPSHSLLSTFEIRYF